MTSERDTSTTSRQEGEITLKDIFFKLRDNYRYLRKKWLKIFLLGIIGAVIGLTYACLRLPTYVATTTFVLDEDDKGPGSLGQYAGIAALAGINIEDGGGIFKGDNIIELYKSRFMIEKALLSETVTNGKSELLIDRFIAAYNLRKKWDRKTALKGLTFTDSAHFNLKQDSLVGEIVKKINKKYLSVFKPDKKLNIIEVDVNSRDQLFAKTFSDRLVSNVNNFYIEIKRKKSAANIAVLEGQRDSVLKVMDKAINTAASTIDITPDLNPTRQALRSPVQKSQFAAEANKEMLSELIAHLELSKVALMKETPVIQVIDQPILPLYKEKASKALSMVFGFIILSFLYTLYLLMRYSLDIK